MSSLWFNDRQQKFLFMRIIIDATRTNHCKCFIRTGVTRKRHLILQHLFRSMGVWHLFMQNKRIRRLKPNSNCLLFKRGAMRALGCVWFYLTHIQPLWRAEELFLTPLCFTMFIFQNCAKTFDVYDHDLIGGNKHVKSLFRAQDSSLPHYSETN